MSEGVELALRTFHKWRIAVEEMFGLVIECERKGGQQFMNKEKHISYNTLLDELFKTWRLEMVKKEKGKFNFTEDGLLYKNDKTIEQTESEWQHSTKRVLFL